MGNNEGKYKIRIEKREAVMFLLMLYIICFADGLVCRAYFQTAFQWSFILFTAVLLIRERVFGREYVKLAVVAGIMLFGMVRIDNISGAWFFKICLFAFAIYMSEKFSMEEFALYYRKVMKFLLVAGLIFFALYLLNVPMSFLPTVVNRRGSSYYTIFISNVPVRRTAGFMTKLRGPFWEPGPFASYICFSLALEFFAAKKKDVKYIVLLLVSLALTFSTTGYLALALVLGALVFRENNKTNHTWMKVGVCALIILMVLLMIYSESLNNKLFSKIYEENESFLGRKNCFTANLMIIKAHPIFGVGVTKGATLIEEYMRSLGSRRAVSNLNTVLSNFTIFGLACGLYFAIKVIRFCFVIGNTKISRLFLLIASMIILSCFGFQYSIFFTLIFFLRKEENMTNSQKN